ncbi:MAG TPA: BatA domain-containing protein [Flavobacteriales bacterium]|nr:BatA domain-containing protein [Flavobacteriales bacterium]
MAFLVPSFLWALTALAIPVLIHLFQLRRFKRIEFPDTRFQQIANQEFLQVDAGQREAFPA